MKKKDSIARQSEITDMAIDIIGEMGPAGLTTARLAERLNMSEPNLYRHFQDKEAILSAVIDEIGVSIKGQAAFVARLNIAPKEKLKRIMASHFDVVEHRSGIPRLIFSEDIHVRYPRLREKTLECIEGYLSALEDILSEGKADGAFKDEINVEQCARMFLGMMTFTSMRWSLSGLSFSLRDEGRRLWENFCNVIETGKDAEVKHVQA